VNDEMGLKSFSCFVSPGLLVLLGLDYYRLAFRVGGVHAQEFYPFFRSAVQGSQVYDHYAVMVLMISVSAATSFQF